MAYAPEIRLPVKADPSHIIGVIDVVVKHLTALREELSAMAGPEAPKPGHRAGCTLLFSHQAPDMCTTAGPESEGGGG